MIDSFSYQNRAMAHRLYDADNMTNDEMPEGNYPIYYNDLEDYALECIYRKRIDALEEIVKFLDMICDSIDEELESE